MLYPMKPATEHIHTSHTYMMGKPYGSLALSPENDHNPVVPVKCANCNGTGKRCDQVGEDAYEMYECQQCRGKGVGTNNARLFEDDTPPIEVAMFSDGWVRCPACNRTFALKDPYMWSGLRHLHCGRKLIPCHNND
jgi:hypothetical protein